MLRHSTFTIGLIALCAVPASGQRGAGNTDVPGFKTLFTVDSAVLGTPFLSSDGKWVLFTQAGGGGTSVWMAAVANPKPFRITSDGYHDTWPTLSPTGDRIFFSSDRPNRDPKSMAAYIMSIPIDKATGRPTGPVQQVTTDSGFRALAPSGLSPDGKWLAYAIPAEGATVAGGIGTRAGLVRLIPANGGNARTLATEYTYSVYPTFSADGQRVLFADSTAKLIRGVSVSSGTVTTNYRAAQNEQVGPIPFRDDRYMTYNLASGTAALRDRNGAILGVTPKLPSTANIRPDGRGMIGATNEGDREVSRRVALATGAIQDVVAPDPTTDKVERTVALNTKDPVRLGGKIQGGKLRIGFGPTYPHTRLLNRYRADTARAWMPAYLIDPATGSVRKLADSVAYGCCFGNGGVTGIAELHGSMVEVKSIDQFGATHLIRSLPLATYTYHGFYWGFIHGSRLAYADRRDSTGYSIFVSTGPAGPPTRIADVVTTGDVTFAWSPDGRKVAFEFGDRQNSGRPTARVINIGADGSVASTGPALDLGIEATDGVTGRMEWLPDASAILAQWYDDNAKICNGCVVLRSLDPARQPVRLIQSTNGLINTFQVEPDGKSVLFSQALSGKGGASIWTADFVPVKKP